MPLELIVCGTDQMSSNKDFGDGVEAFKVDPVLLLGIGGDSKIASSSNLLDNRLEVGGIGPRWLVGDPAVETLVEANRGILNDACTEQIEMSERREESIDSDRTVGVGQRPFQVGGIGVGGQGRWRWIVDETSLCTLIADDGLGSLTRTGGTQGERALVRKL